MDKANLLDSCCCRRNVLAIKAAFQSSLENTNRCLVGFEGASEMLNSMCFSKAPLVSSKNITWEKRFKQFERQQKSRDLPVTQASVLDCTVRVVFVTEELSL